eukprot:jgi/Hompol1/703/HPOL_000442-RA
MLFEDALAGSISRNYADVTKEIVRVALASVKPDGSPKVHQIVFHEQLHSDRRVLIFTAAARNAELMSVLKGGKNHEVYWQMAASNESFVLTGKMHVIAAPTLSARFGFAKRLGVVAAGASADDFWERERLRVWAALDAAHRASFTWPAPGETRSLQPLASWSVYDDAAANGSNGSGVVRVRVAGPAPPSRDVGFSVVRLDALVGPAATEMGKSFSIAASAASAAPSDKLEDKPSTLPRATAPTSMAAVRSRFNSITLGAPMSVTGASASASASASGNPGGMNSENNAQSSDEQDLMSLHNSALDNFCLLVFKPSRVDHTAFLPGLPAQRYVYTLSKDGEWFVEDLNP